MRVFPLALLLVTASAAGAQDLAGPWTVWGRDASGPYRGTTALSRAGATVRGTLDLERLVVGPDGVSRPMGTPRLRVRLEGRVEGTTLRATRTQEAGLIGGAWGGASPPIAVTYSIDLARPAGASLPPAGLASAARRLVATSGIEEVLHASVPGEPAADAPRPGDWGAPLLVPGLPFAHAGSTVGRRSLAQRYAPRPATSEAGPEVVYRLDVPAAGRLRVEVEGDRDPVDVDVQVLRSLALDASGTAVGGIARDDEVVEVDVPAGPVFVVVDTFQSARRAGPYVLRVDLVPRDGFRVRQVAQGVALRTKVYADLFGGKQTASVLDVDPRVPGVVVRPVLAQGCATTSALAAREGCVAAVNGGFFGDGCRSLSLARIDGATRATNAKDRTAIGFDAQGRASLRLVPAGRDWPEVRHALGGVPRLLERGAIVVTPGAEQSAASFTTSRHPRTGVAIAPDGRLLLATLDGRTQAGLGASLPDFAQWLAWLGASDALNLDGGGSTTLWVRGRGVINTPSDGRERPVSTILGVWAPALDRDAVWLTPAARGDLAPGQAWSHEVVAAAPEASRVTFRLDGEAPAGFVLDDRGDGTCRLSWPSAWPATSSTSGADLLLVADVAGGRPVTQTVTLRRR